MLSMIYSMFDQVLSYQRQTSGNLFTSTVLWFVQDKFSILEITSNVMILDNLPAQPYAKVFWDSQVQDR